MTENKITNNVKFVYFSVISDGTNHLPEALKISKWFVKISVQLIRCSCSVNNFYCFGSTVNHTGPRAVITVTRKCYNILIYQVKKSLKLCVTCTCFNYG
jgi:hypothetical protein